MVMVTMLISPACFCDVLTLPYQPLVGHYRLQKREPAGFGNPHFGQITLGGGNREMASRTRSSPSHCFAVSASAETALTIFSTTSSDRSRNRIWHAAIPTK